MTATPKATTGSLRRTAIGLLALAALWNGVYWLWPVHREAPVVMAGVGEEPIEALPTEEGLDFAGEPEDDPVMLTMGPPEIDPTPEHDPQLIVDPILHDPEHQTFIVPPQFERYTVTNNDRNLGDIASRFYGDRSLSTVIAQANPYRDPRRITPGQVWFVPKNPANIQGLTVDAQGNLIDAPTPQPPPAEFTEYVVRGGDTLGAISKLHYKTTRHADAIFAFNRERLGLDSPRAIRPGQVLRIPKQPQ